MKRILSFSALALFCNFAVAQVDYYDITTHENVNQNINVCGTVYENKTVTTIDYGALAEANANMQRLQFERQKYADEQQRQMAYEMAANPVKAYDYGHDMRLVANKKIANGYGFKKYEYVFRIPHKDLFYEVGGHKKLENISYDGIKTEILISTPKYNVYNDPWVAKPDLSIIKEDTINEGLSYDGSSIFVYKKALTKSTVFGWEGYKLTMIWEDEYQYCITDNYMSVYQYENGIRFFVKVRTYGNKDEVTLEQLEGRRYYFRPLIEKIISTAKLVDDFKVCKTKKREE